MTIEATRYLSWRACHAVDTQSPAADELAIQAKIYGSETAVRVITDLMRVVGIDSYDHEAPLGRLLQDALALPIFDGGNMGIRRRQLHNLLKRPDYDALLASDAFESYSAQQCLDMAKDCGRMASQAKDRDAKAALIEFARQWLELARHKEQSGRLP